MEGKMNWLFKIAMFQLVWLIVPGSFSSAQENAQEIHDGAAAEISLRKTIGAREYKGKNIEGDEREVRVGETLWHILVRERGFPGERFKEYFVLIRGLNPQVKTPEGLRAGDKLFIPLKPNEALGLALSEPAPSAERVANVQGKTRGYTVKPGEHLYQILRTQLGALEDRKLWQYFAVVKDLNPQKNNWDVIEKGETIRLPVTGGEPETASLHATVPAPSAAPANGPQPAGGDPQPATSHLPLFEKEGNGEILDKCDLT